MTRPVAGAPTAGAAPGQAAAPGGEFSRGRVWLVATLCGLLGLSLVLVALAAADKRVGVLAPLWGSGGPPTTQAAPPPPEPAPPVPEAPSAEPAKSASSARSARPAEAAKKARARESAPSAADQGSSESDSDSSESDSDSFEPAGPPGFGQGHGWGQYDRNQRLAQEMMRYRMNAGYPEHHR
ncbi:MAG TPA: hypothetical protein VGP05_21510 [Pseudonocardia sp.]|nr:hypothetical protein [Pseudonocardia sp.]